MNEHRGDPGSMSWLSYLSVVLIIGLNLLLTVSGAYSDQYEVKLEYDVCNPKTAVSSPNTVYLPSLQSSTEVYVDSSSVNCLLYIRTCNNCQIKVTNTGYRFDYPPCQLSVPPDEDIDNVCIPNCVYFYLFDADYRSQTAQAVSRSPVSYTTESRQLHVIACGINYTQTIRMRLKLTVVEKLEEIDNTDVYNSLASGFTSPYFPNAYAKNSEVYTFKLHAQEPYKIVVVSFDDWMLTPSSYLEFHGTEEVRRFMGNENRPVIKSVGQNLTVTFYTGEATSSQSSFLGFKASVKFINYFTPYPIPLTVGDQDISTDGGIITLTIADGQLTDSIFVIRKISKFDGVYLRVLKRQSDDPSDSYDYSFDIRSGITSLGELKVSIQRNEPLQNNTVFLSHDGFYIRFTGKYYQGTDHVLSYAMFIYDCEDYRGDYFKCNNDLCIPLKLKCDGYDHCGDGSDEYTSLCSYETTHSSGSYPITISIIIPLVVSIFLIIVMCVLIIFIRRCRRLNNEARNRRPPGTRSNRQRLRRNRDVQMSVTVRSGEHPPSYDEVLQNTPIGYLNMAFTWSQHGHNLAQPPSYEEAISPAAQQNGSIIITATANNGIGHDEANRSSHQSSATVLTTTISASLDPRAEVSSSSSSDDAPEHFRQYDFSTSSDSSGENMTQNSHNIDNSRSNVNLIKAGKDMDNDAGSRSSLPKYGNHEEAAQVVLGSPGSAKINLEGQERVKPEINQQMEESVSGRNLNNAGRNQFNVKEVRDLQQSFGDLRNVSEGGEGRELVSPQKCDGRSAGTQNHTASGREDFRSAERESQQERERVEMYQYHKNKGKQSHRNADREIEPGRHQGTHASGLNVHPPKVTDTSRSQSCFDLSLGAGAVRSLDRSMARMRDEDKRFSYAGAGDTSLARGGLDPLYSGRGLIREKPLEHLDQYATQSYDNIRDGDTIRKQGKLDYEAGNEQDEVQQHRHSRSANSPGYFPKSTRDKTDSQRARGQHSSLAPVKENLYDEAYLPVSGREASQRHVYTERTDDQPQETSPNNTWSQHRRNPLESGREASQGHELPTQKTGPSQEHLLPGSARSWPSDRMAVVPGHNHVNRHDHRKPSSGDSSRKQAELPSSRNNFNAIQSLSANSNKNSVANSGMQNDTSRSGGGASAEYNNVPQPGQDTGAGMFRPKPSLRKSRMKTAKRPDGHLTESLPNNSQGHAQASHRPVPAPRHAINKPEPVDGKGPQADAQHEWGMQGTNRPWSGQNERGDDSSLHTTDHINSRDRINVKTTNDDVFV